MATCRDYSALVSQSLDSNLSWWQRVRLRIHLWLCPPCKRFQDQAQSLRHILKKRGASVSAPLPSGMSESAKERIRSAIKEKVRDD